MWVNQCLLLTLHSKVLLEKDKKIAINYILLFCFCINHFERQLFLEVFKWTFCSITFAWVIAVNHINVFSIIYHLQCRKRSTCTSFYTLMTFRSILSTILIFTGMLQTMSFWKLVGVSELTSLKTYQVSKFCNWIISRKMLLFTDLILLYKKYFLGCIFSWVSLFICATKSSMKSPWLVSSSYYACFSLLFFVLPYLSK